MASYRIEICRLYRKEDKKSQAEEELKCFKSHFGVRPSTVGAVIHDNPDLKVEHFFMTLNWWKLYLTEDVMEGKWDRHPETIRRIVKTTTALLASLKKDKINFRGFPEDQTYLASIDCVHFETDEFRTDPHSKWYSHKHNGPGLSYEVCCDIVQDRIVWTSGPYAASAHDITIFRGGTKKEGKSKWRNTSLYGLVPDGKRLIGDSGYVGEPTKIATTLGGHPAAVKIFLQE